MKERKIKMRENIITRYKAQNLEFELDSTRLRVTIGRNDRF